MSKKTGNSSNLLIRKVRHFSEVFKKKIVDDLEKGIVKIPEVSLLYDIKKQTIYQWIYRYSVHHKKGTRMVVEMESEAKKTLALQQRIGELERIVGQKQLSLDYLEKLVELASTHFEVDLKKNFASSPSAGLEKIKSSTLI